MRLTLFAIALTLFGCRSEEEELFIQECTAACEIPYDQGCPERASQDLEFCEQHCENQCDDLPEDCLDEAIAADTCRAASEDVCVVPWLDCDAEDLRLVTCLAIEGSAFGILFD